VGVSVLTGLGDSPFREYLPVSMSSPRNCCKAHFVQFDQAAATLFGFSYSRADSTLYSGWDTPLFLLVAFGHVEVLSTGGSLHVTLVEGCLNLTVSWGFAWEDLHDFLSTARLLGQPLQRVADTG
jgi:hypothetical protein